MERMAVSTEAKPVSMITSSGLHLLQLQEELNPVQVRKLDIEDHHVEALVLKDKSASLAGRRLQTFILLFVSCFLKASTRRASSSTMRPRSSSSALSCRKADGEGGPVARLAFHLDGPSHIALQDHGIEDNPRPMPLLRFLGGEKGLEDLLYDGIGNPCAVVLDLHDRTCPSRVLVLIHMVASSLPSTASTALLMRFTNTCRRAPRLP